jgi:hypothetical protein
MTTSKSPLSKLKAQADKIAKTMKAVERGERVAADPAGKIAAALARGMVKFGILMDDKIITVEMPTAVIRESSEAAISEWVINYMRGIAPTVQ